MIQKAHISPHSINIKLTILYPLCYNKTTSVFSNLGGVFVHKSNPIRWAHVLPELNKEKFYIVHHPALQHVTPHSHLFFELTYILSGTVKHSIDGKTSILHAGDYFLVDYGSVHS